MKLHRCDVCHALIDPLENEDRTELRIQLEDDDAPTCEAESLDLCPACRPASIGGFHDWLIHQIEQQEGFQ